MISSNSPIGVFDSGVGGLTVLEDLKKIFTNEDFIYVADQGHCPYGTKTSDEIKNCVLRIGNYLISREVKAIVIACNTASLFKDELIKITNIPVINVIEPTADFAMKSSKTKKIAVLGTNATIKKGTYQKILKNHGYTPYAVPCSEFVDFVEQGDLDDPFGDTLVENKLMGLNHHGIDTLIHGCTHFSIIEDKMKKVLGNLNYVACGTPTALVLRNVLAEKELLNEQTKNGKIELYTTGDINSGKKAMKWFKLTTEALKHLDI